MAEPNDFSGWVTPPFKHADTQIEPFLLDVPAHDVEEFHKLLSVLRLAPKTYENSFKDGRYGVSHEWMTNALDFWRNKYDWKTRQAGLNRHPQFKTPVKDDDGYVYDVHFMALFSKRQDALPIVMVHGWPGAYLEFHNLLDVVRSKYTPESCPFHLIVPSVPGFTLSSGPRLDGDFKYRDAARIIDRLMAQLGFAQGYVVQGGDMGGIMAPVLAKYHSNVKAIHVNLVYQPKPEGFPELQDDPDLSEADKFKFKRGMTFQQTGSGYNVEQMTRPATVGWAIGSNPISLLAWVGEKLLEWTDQRSPLPLETVLDLITVYWFTDTIARNQWLYRDHPNPEIWVLDGLQKPVGYSRFPYDVDFRPRKWVERMCDLRFFRDHEVGGHFAAMEVPELLWADIEEFLRGVFPERFS